MADLRGRFRLAPPTVQNFLNFMQFFRKFGIIIGWCPFPGESWIRPCEGFNLGPESKCLYMCVLGVDLALATEMFSTERLLYITSKLFASC